MTNQDESLDCRIIRERGSDFIDGELSPPARQAIEAHLADCPSCNRFLKELRLTVETLAELRLDAPGEEARAKALKTFHDYFPEPEAPEDEADWTRVKQLWGELSGLSAEGKVAAINRESKYRDQELCAWLMNKAEESLSSHPRRADLLTESCLLILKALGEAEATPDMVASCWAIRAVVKATISNLEAADAALNRAVRCCADVGIEEISALTRARLVTGRGWINSARGRTEKASADFTEAIGLLLAAGENQRAACMKINLGSTWLQSDRPETAVAVLSETLNTLAEVQAPARVCLAALSNLALAYCETGDVEKGRTLLPDIKRLTEEVGGDSHIRFDWLLGTVSRVTGNWKVAWEKFAEVQALFKERGEYIHYVESSLDMVRVLLARGDWRALGAVVAEAALVSEQLGAGPEVIAALRLLEADAGQRTLDEARVRALTVVLRRGSWVLKSATTAEA